MLASLAVPVMYILDTGERQRYRNRLNPNSTRGHPSQVVAVIEVVHTSAEPDPLPLLHVIADLLQSVGFTIGGFIGHHGPANLLYEFQAPHLPQGLPAERTMNIGSSHETTCHDPRLENFALTEINRLMVELADTVKLPLLQLWKVSSDSQEQLVRMQTHDLPYIISNDSCRHYRLLCCLAGLSDGLGPVGCCKVQGNFYCVWISHCFSLNEIS